MTDGNGEPDADKKETISNLTVLLDGQRYENKRFLDCQLVYTGGPPPSLVDCIFIRCGFILDGPALFTARYLGALAKSDPNARKLVLNMLGIEG